MVFHSFQFPVFLVTVVGLYWSLANHRSARYLLLLAASYFFYGAYEAWYLSLIVFSTLLDFKCGHEIHTSQDPKTRRNWLLLSLMGNLGLLGFFKYTDWAIDSLQMFLSAVGFEVDLSGAKLKILPGWLMDSTGMKILVPVGISFYTFQTLSYTIDIYRRRLAPARNLREFALFVAFFPQLVAGPIVRAAEFLPQLDIRPRFDRQRLEDGLYRLGLGLSKKVILADIIGKYIVDPVYGSPGDYDAIVHLIALYAFAFQIYFDFSGYSDIAIGAGRLMGFDLPENFDLPFRSRSIREFWRRWHISLSSWVRDYVYFPLGGSRGSEPKVARNLMLTMLVIGIWHGASILWVYYGLLQGIVMVSERWLERQRGGGKFATTRARSLLSWLLSFHFVALTLVFVRGKSMQDVQGLFTNFGESGVGDLVGYGLLALGFGALSHFGPPVILREFKRRISALPLPLGGVILGVVVGVIAVLMVGETPYIYFQF